MYAIIFKLFALSFCIVIVLYLVAGAFRKARRLDARIQKFKEEQEEAQKQGRVQDPYAALAELYTEEKPKEKPAARRARFHR